MPHSGSWGVVLTIASKPRSIFRPDPLIGWTLTPDARVQVPFRENVVQTMGSDGWRFVPGASDDRDHVLAIYGCSYTYGTCLTDEETYPALLQQRFPGIRVLNRGVGGHGTVQNLVQFQSDLIANRVNSAIFGVFSDHRYRNIGHPKRMRQHLDRAWYELGVEHLPVARHTRAGDLRIEYIPIWQPGLLGMAFDDFLPDDHLIDRATISVFQAIVALAGAHGIPVTFVLLDNLDTDFNNLMLERFPQAVDISTPFDAGHNFLPDDNHPNPHANELFASRLAQHGRSLPWGRDLATP